MATVEPRDDGLVILLADVGIAKHGMLGTATYGLLNGRGNGKVHIGHPQGDYIIDH